MNGQHPLPTWLPALGCLTMLAVVALMCLMPLVLADLMHTALTHLHLSPATAVLSVVGIFLGSLINVPLYRIQRDELQVAPVMGAWGMWAFTPRFQRLRQNTVVAVNVGGCVIPVLLALWQVRWLLEAGGWPATAQIVVVAANVVACYLVARPVRGVGIMMPGFVSPLVAVSMTWLLLGGVQFAEVRAGVAFVGGVAGPLVGADLLRLRQISRVAAGMLSIGGAGTFDGIVLSGVLAALLA